MNLSVKVKIVVMLIIVFGSVAVFCDLVLDMKLYGPLGGSAFLFYWMATRKKTSGTDD
jgi:hypothetical protein